MVKPYLLFAPMFAVNALETYHLYAIQQAGNAAERMKGDGTLWAQAVILLTTLATLGYQVYTRHMDAKDKLRQREWDLEDRRLAREEAIARGEVAKHEVKEVVRDEAAKVTTAVEVNTKITADAAAAADAAAIRAGAAEARLQEVVAMFEGTNGHAGSSSGHTDAARTAAPRDPQGIHSGNRDGGPRKP